METASPSSFPVTPQQTKRPFVFIAVLVILAALIVGGSYWGKSYFIKQPVPASPTPLKPNSITLTGLELAQKILSFFENTKQPDGSYPNVIRCNAKGTSSCTPLPESSFGTTGHFLLPVVYLELANATNDQSYLQKADDMLTNAITYCKDSYKTVPDCYDYTLTLGMFFNETKNPKYKEQALLLQPAIDAAIAKKETEVDRLFKRASRVAYYYFLTNQEPYSEHAARLYTEAKTKNTGPIVHDCNQANTALSLYTAFNDKAYLDEAITTIENAPKNSDGEFNSTSNFQIQCIRGFLALFDLTKDVKYKDTAAKAMDQFLLKFSDYSKTTRYEGDFGIVWGIVYRPTQMGDQNLKGSTFNLWTIYALLQMKENKFEFLE